MYRSTTGLFEDCEHRIRVCQVFCFLFLSYLILCTFVTPKSPKISCGVCQKDLMKLAGYKGEEKKIAQLQATRWKAFRAASLVLPECTFLTWGRGDEGGQENGETLTTWESVTGVNCGSLRLGFLLHFITVFHSDTQMLNWRLEDYITVNYSNLISLVQ